MTAGRAGADVVRRRDVVIHARPDRRRVGDDRVSFVRAARDREAGDECVLPEAVGAVIADAS